MPSFRRIRCLEWCISSIYCKPRDAGALDHVEKWGIWKEFRNISKRVELLLSYHCQVSRDGQAEDERKGAGASLGEIEIRQYSGVRKLYLSHSFKDQQVTHSHLNTAQNALLWLITGVMKTTPIQAIEKNTSLHPLEYKREEKVYNHIEKLRRIPTYHVPMRTEMQNPTKNRKMRKSLNHHFKSFHRKIEDLLRTSWAEMMTR